MVATDYRVPTPPATADEASDAAIGAIMMSLAVKLQMSIANKAGEALHAAPPAYS
jgi:hypothetical protein